MKYAKLINQSPQFATNPILVGGNWVGNPPGSVYLELGYKPLRFTGPPEFEPGYYAVYSWREDSEEIVQVWTIIQEI